ncbi:MAG: GNAT family acetyltransferase [Eubacteriales bacterium]
MIEKPIIFNYYNYKSPYYGSYHGMRFCLVREGEKPDFQLAAITWPEPFCIEVTPDEKKVKKIFSFTEEGYDEAIQWLNNQYQSYE